MGRLIMKVTIKGVSYKFLPKYNYNSFKPKRVLTYANGFTVRLPFGSAVHVWKAEQSGWKPFWLKWIK